MYLGDISETGNLGAWRHTPLPQCFEKMLFFPARTFSHLTKDYGLRLKKSLIAVGNFLDIEVCFYG